MGASAFLAKPPRLPLIAPSVLSADFARLEIECSGVLEAGADLLHLDVMDGHFVPNLTMGPDVCRCLRRALPDVYLDVHLMVENPAMFVEPFAKAGASNLTFHTEVVQGEAAAELVKRIQGAGMQAGVAIKPATPLHAALPLLAAVDMVLVMCVNPGFSGQAFMSEVLEKTRRVKSLLRADQRLEMDGGLSPENVAAVRGAGCDVMVMGSALMGHAVEERQGIIQRMRGT